jgi:hypothetical protein
MNTYSMTCTGAALATLLLLAACGRESTATATAAVAGPAPGAPAAGATAPRAALASNEVCALLTPELVKAVLDVAPTAKPEAVPSSPESSMGRCAWESGGMVGTLVATVLQGHEDIPRMLILKGDLGDEALPGIGDKAGVTVQGDYDVEVNVLVGERRLTVNLNGVGAAGRRDAVIAAARAAAARLR